MIIKFFIGLSLVLTSCGESDKSKIARAEKECQQKTDIEGLEIYFYGYFTSDADSIDVKIKRGDKIIENYKDKIPEQIEDSLRHLRQYNIARKILLTDTLILKIKSEPEKKNYGFKYFVRPHFTMFNRDWGCDFYGFTVDGTRKDGEHADFMKKGWDVLERKDFGTYYYNNK